MVQNPPVALIDKQQLAQTLGTVINNSDFTFFLKKIEIQQPATGQQFWSASEGNAGIYIVLSGRVRLVDSDRQLITTLNQGDSFGESTIFDWEKLL